MTTAAGLQRCSLLQQRRMRAVSGNTVMMTEPVSKGWTWTMAARERITKTGSSPQPRDRNAESTTNFTRHSGASRASSRYEALDARRRLTWRRRSDLSSRNTGLGHGAKTGMARAQSRSFGSLQILTRPLAVFLPSSHCELLMIAFAGAKASGCPEGVC